MATSSSDEPELARSIKAVTPLSMAVVVIWLARVFVGLHLLTAVASLVPTGIWYIRLWDFPRVQLLLLLVIPLGLICWHWALEPNHTEHWVLYGLVALVGIYHIVHIVPFTPMYAKELPDAQPGSEEGIKVMVVNMEFENDQYEAARNAIHDAEPDILLLIEMNEKWHTELEPIAEHYPHQVNEPRGEGLGLALWSRLPLVNPEVQYLVSDRRSSINTKIQLPNGNLVHLYGLHPTPPGLKDSTGEDRRDSRVRDAELIIVAKKIRERPHESWIVMGDFNDVAWSHTTRLFKRISGLKDPRVGRKLLDSYHAQYPLFRYPIDQVFFSADSQIHELDRIRIPGSDHFSIYAVVTPSPGTDPDTEFDDEEDADEIIDEGAEDAEERDVATEEVKEEAEE